MTPRKDPPWVSQQELEQAVLRFRQLQTPLAAVCLVQGEVNAQVGESDLSVLQRLHRRSVISSGPPHASSHASEQLVEYERLDEVVIGTSIEPFDAVTHTISRCQHEDGSLIAFPANAPADLDPIDDRHRNVEHHEIDLPRAKQLERFATFCGERHAVALETQGSTDSLTKRAIVVYKQDAAAVRHRLSVGQKSKKLARARADAGPIVRPTQRVKVPSEL